MGLHNAGTAHNVRVAGSARRPGRQRAPQSRTQQQPSPVVARYPLADCAALVAPAPPLDAWQRLPTMHTPICEPQLVDSVSPGSCVPSSGRDRTSLTPGPAG